MNPQAIAHEISPCDSMHEHHQYVGSSIAANDRCSSSTNTMTTTAATRTLHRPIYVDSKQSWELTWPIWHMLPRAERKTIAHQYGYNTIGDFEEFMSLSRALSQVPSSEEVTIIHTSEQSPLEHANTRGDNSATSTKAEISHHATATSTQTSHPLAHRAQTQVIHYDDDFPDKDIKELKMSHLEYTSSTAKTDKQQQQALVQNGGRILMLPDDILIYKIFAFLDVDYFALCALVSPHWKTFTRTEAVYKEICHRSYLQQAKRKELNVSKFDNSYRRMLYWRPRVKTGGGLYVLKFSQIKKIQRDMWTEIPIGAVLETTYYRYAYFQENGKVLYALSPLAPHEMIPKFVKVRKEGYSAMFTDHKSGILWGSYQVQKFQVTIHVSHAWHDVKLELKILEYGCEEARGRFWALSFERHFSSASGDFDEYWSRDLVEYTTPHQPFLFLRDWRL